MRCRGPFPLPQCASAAGLSSPPEAPTQSSVERDDLSDLSPSASGVAERYAHALFELARDENAIDAVDAEMADIRQMLDESEDLRRLVRSPVFAADDQVRALKAVLDKAGVKGLAANFVLLAARNRRLFALPGMLTAWRALLAEHRGETTAEVTTARKLGVKQTKSLKDQLKKSLGKDVAVDVRIDPSLLGGLIVKVGSRQIDTSLRTKLNLMKTRLKEAG